MMYHSAADEFRPLIVDCFPKLVASLKDGEKRVRKVGAYALANLSEIGEKKLWLASLC